jgi:hypothetical protein
LESAEKKDKIWKALRKNLNLESTPQKRQNLESNKKRQILEIAKT